MQKFECQLSHFLEEKMMYLHPKSLSFSSEAELHEENSITQEINVNFCDINIDYSYDLRPLYKYRILSLSDFLSMYDCWNSDFDFSEEEFGDLCEINLDSITKKTVSELWSIQYSKNFIIKIIVKFGHIKKFNENITKNVNLVCKWYEERKQKYDICCFGFYGSVCELNKNYREMPNCDEIIETLKNKFQEREIRVVSEQSNVSTDLAIIALEMNKGDMVNAIMELTM
jgi:NACalpha-BTF3-like transcription factor